MKDYESTRSRPNHHPDLTRRNVPEVVIPSTARDLLFHNERGGSYRKFSTSMICDCCQPG
jgi:hypothetical protein